MYVRTDVVDYPYLLVVAEIIGLSIFAARRFLFSNKDLLNWQMFFLGAAFMLLELHAITFLSLLFGATWLTSAIVITFILLMILCVNLAVLKFGRSLPQHMPIMSYVALLGLVIVNYLVPGEQTLSAGVTGGVTGHVAAVFMAILPLAFNLFGAVIDGLLEYVSSYTGIRSLLLVSFMLYLGSLVCWFSRRKNLAGPAPEVTLPVRDL